jgi:2-methylisocitrate lyase-like PEP mutase family enzyme
LFARIIEDLGYEAVYVTGAGVANMYLGAPDIGLTTLTEIAGYVAVIADAVALPLLVAPIPASAMRSIWCAP